MNNNNISEYEALRDEMDKWQDRRITICQLAVGAIIAYTAFLLTSNISVKFSFEAISLPPLLVGILALHIIRLVEFYIQRITSYFIIFHSSIWDRHVHLIRPKDQMLKLGYHRSWGLTVLGTSLSSLFILSKKFSFDFTIWGLFAFGLAGILLIITFLQLFFSRPFVLKKILADKWQDLKQKISDPELSAEKIES